MPVSSKGQPKTTSMTRWSKPVERERFPSSHFREIGEADILKAFTRAGRGRRRCDRTLAGLLALVLSSETLSAPQCRSPRIRERPRQRCRRRASGSSTRTISSTHSRHDREAVAAKHANRLVFRRGISRRRAKKVRPSRTHSCIAITSKGHFAEDRGPDEYPQEAVERTHASLNARVEILNPGGLEYERSGCPQVETNCPKYSKHPHTLKHPGKCAMSRTKGRICGNRNAAGGHAYMEPPKPVRPGSFSLTFCKRRLTPANSTTTEREHRERHPRHGHRTRNHQRERSGRKHRVYRAEPFLNTSITCPSPRRNRAAAGKPRP